MRRLGDESVTLRGGRVLDPAAGVDEVRDLRIEDGVLTAMGRDLPPVRGMVEVDLQGACVAPGLLDVHVHLREPGQSYKETIATGTRAAVKGGFTAVACMPNTQPVLDRGCHVEEVNRAKGKVCPVLPIGALTKDLAGAQLAEYGELVAAGCVAFSDDGHGVQSAAVTRRAMQFCQMYDRPFIQHLEDETLSGGGSMHAGAVSTRLGLGGIPAEAETVMLARDLLLVEATGVRYHAAHVSTKGAVEMLRRALDQGLPVSGEACPHHFDLTDERVGAYDTHAKVNPPLRSDEHRQAVVEAVLDGTLGVIATDHAPHAAEEKALEFSCAPFGISGLESALAVTLTRLHHKEGMPLLDLVDRMSLGPAKLLGLEHRGRLTLGRPADLTIFDPSRTWTLTPEHLESKGQNNAWMGRELRGRPLHAFVEGCWWDLTAHE